jgi:hypothetical protein
MDAHNSRLLQSIDDSLKGIFIILLADNIVVIIYFISKWIIGLIK